MSVVVHHGDSRDIVPTLGTNSIDSCVTDPPYSLVSIQKRFGKVGSAPAKDRDGLYKRASAGFMGKQWDTGETAFDPAFWAEVLRVLKPGGHLLAFGGDRTHHRLFCAIEDAGFEIRRTVLWLYGSGFPKSHDVGKAIDRAQRRNYVAAAINLGLRIPGNNLHDWTKAEHSPGDKWWNEFRRVLSPEQWGAIEREVLGSRRVQRGVAFTSCGPDELPITAPATEAARQWGGWGTDLKPAAEFICLARKPLIGTVAENVLQYGTGALNIGACRIAATDNTTKAWRGAGERDREQYRTGTSGKPVPTNLGRWPANVIHDGSDEVLEAFARSGERKAGGPVKGTEPSHTGVNVYGEYGRVAWSPHVDSGSAARFFYTAKADATDRLGSKHPTVKPVDLIAYLCRLVTPPGGTVLDPFAGSGTLATACLREGFSAVLVEREAEYVQDIRRRLAHVSGEDAPLFGGAAP